MYNDSRIDCSVPRCEVMPLAAGLYAASLASEAIARPWHHAIRTAEIWAQEIRYFDGKCARRGMPSCHIAVVSPSGTVHRNIMCAVAFASSRCLRKKTGPTARFPTISESSADGIFIHGVGPSWSQQLRVPEAQPIYRRFCNPR